MPDLIPLVERAKAGDPTAFNELVYRFQDMTTGYAFSVLGDFHLAQDASQEAFLEVSRNLDQLRLPQAFPGWLRKAVFKHCDRIKRRKTVPILPLETVEGLASPNDTAAIVEAKETKAIVLDAVRALSDHHRAVMTLFYIKDLTQKEIADFLEVPVTTVNARLHGARKEAQRKEVEYGRGRPA